MNRTPILPTRFLETRFLGDRLHVARMQMHEGRVTLGPVGQCPHRPTCTWFVFDNSGSVSGTYGNDPVARRFDEALLAVRAVARRCSCGQERVAVVHFDTPVSLDLAPTLLAGNGWRTAARCLAIPPDGAGQSLLRASLHGVLGHVDAMPDHQHTLVVCSDFLLFDDDIAELYEEFGSFPGDVHAVCLRSTPPQILIDDQRVTVTHITADAKRGSVAAALLAGLTTYRL